MYTAMKSIFADKNEQEKLFFDGPGQDLDVRHWPDEWSAVAAAGRTCFYVAIFTVLAGITVLRNKLYLDVW